MEAPQPNHDQFSVRSWFQWLPWVLIAIAIVESFFPLYYSHSTSNILRFLSAIIFLDITHNAFGFSMLLHPRVSAIVRAKAPGSEYFRSYVLESIVLITVCTVFFAMTYGAFATSKRSLLLIVGTAIHLKWMLSVHHSTYQTQGLSLLMNKWLGASTNVAESDASIPALERRERFFARLSNIAIQITAISSLLTQFDARFSIAGLTPICVAVATLGICGWLYTTLSYPGIASKKTMFVSRAFLTPLTYSSNLAKLGHKAVHGFEYLFIYRKVLKNGGASVKTKRFIYASVLLIAMVAIFGTLRITGFLHLLYPAWARSRSHVLLPNYKWVCWVAGFSEALTVYHYYMDRKIFRFREPAVRDAMGELLGVPREASVESERVDIRASA